MTKLFTAITAALISSTSFVSAATRLDIDQTCLFHEQSGINYKYDNFGNCWPQMDDLEGEMLTSALGTFVTSITQDPEAKESAILIQLPLDDFGKSAALKAAGFTFHHATDVSLQWKVQNGSPMPDPMTSTGGARIITMNEQGKILIIEDKNLRGRLMFPGGSNDKGELLQTTAVREALEEVGLTVQLQDCHLVAQMNRTGGNRYGANDVSAYYLVTSFAGEISTQESEISWAGWADLDDILNSKGFVASETKFLRASAVSLAILQHIKDGATKSQMLVLPDLRQAGKPIDQQNANGVLHLNLFAAPSSLT